MDAFAALMEPMRPALVRVAAGVVGESDAEDVVMDALLRVWRALPAFRQGASVRTWVIRIVRNGALDSLRSRSRRREVSLEQEGDGEDEPTTMDFPDPSVVHPGDAMGSAEDREVVSQALARLEGVHRRALELRYMDDLSYGEIAEATGVSIGTVMSRIFYAKRKLAKLLPTGRRAAAGAGDVEAGS
jgi:RNA polymerase sigma-70 factor (ECF subfamily)